MLRLKYHLVNLYNLLVDNLPQDDKDVIKAETELNKVIRMLGHTQLNKHQALLVKGFLNKYKSLLEDVDNK